MASNSQDGRSWHRGVTRRFVVWGAFLAAQVGGAAAAHAADLKVMRTGVGSGAVTSSLADVSCGADCDETYVAPVSVTLTATPVAGSVFLEWGGDCAGTAPTCTVTMNQDRSVRAKFDSATPIPTLADFTPTGLTTYLAANPSVDTAAKLIRALPAEHRQNWIMMSRSESLQTGTAASPRFLLPSADSRFVFTFGLTTHSAYPGSHPNAIEYMQWDATQKNFRFHEIVLAAIPPMGTVPARSRGVSVDDARCTKCHSTRNVLNPGPFPGTTGIPVGLVKAKNKPNWDPYDSWAGMLPFNRDRIYQGTVETAAFRKVLNPWTWRTNDEVRSVIEQLDLQPPGVPANHVITRLNGGRHDGHLVFSFDALPGPVLTEPAPAGTSSSSVNYGFNAVAGVGPGTAVTRGGSFVTLHHSNIPSSDEGRGVRFFDAMGGLAGTLNQERIADEVVSHRFATGSFPIDVRPVALAIAKGCVVVNQAANTVNAAAGAPALTVNLGFFNARNGMTINDLVTDTRARAQSVPRRKADIQKLNLDRTGDLYLVDPTDGLIQRYGAFTTAGVDTTLARLRQDVFRRPIDVGAPDSTVMGGIYVDRELYSNTNPVALYRYFLEPLGVSVDKWSMGVRGRSRTYAFADVFSTYTNTLRNQLEASLTSTPVPGLAAPFSCNSLIPAVNATLGALPAAAASPTYTDVQRIFNKGCIECHGGLDYPPFSEFFPAEHLDLSEDESPPAGDQRLTRSYEMAVDFTSNDPATSYLYQRLIDTSEACPFGLMPCGGPPLSKVDIETIRRWIVGGRASTVGDPHVQTVDGVHYDFQSAGEFVLLRGEGLEIQVRQTPVATDAPLPPNGHTGLSSCASVNTAVALRVGRHRISYQPNPSGNSSPEGLELRIDGKLIKLEKGTLNLPGGGRLLTTTAAGGIQIEAPGGTDVIVTPGWWAHYQIWYLNVDVRHARATEGVIGTIAPGNWLPRLPDGDFLGARPAALADRYGVLYEKFANAWRVTDADTLFEYAGGNSTKTFTLEEWPRFEPKSCHLPSGAPGPKAPPQKPLPAEVAKRLCGNIAADERRDNCMQDVMATGEAGFAKAYLATEAITANLLPTAPALVGPKDNAVGVGSAIRFSWGRASDQNDDQLRYQHCLWAAGEKPTFAKCVPANTLSRTVFDLKPRTAYFWKVIVEDGRGGTVESPIRRLATR
ncbi:MAG TPA: hypothetical protein VGG33_16605 [Polyangia bacterium]